MSLSILMAKIVAMEMNAGSTNITLQLSDTELKNLDLNNQVVVFSKNKLDFKANTHKVPSKSGKSFYLLMPSGLRKQSEKLPLKEKQKFACGLLESAEGGYVIYHWEN